MDKLGLGDFHALLTAGRAVCHQARPTSGLFVAAEVVLGCWDCFEVLGQELEEEQDGTDRPWWL